VHRRLGEIAWSRRVQSRRVFGSAESLGFYFVLSFFPASNKGEGQEGHNWY
jgi:hypothetical protein